jgi:hypothetical protein
MHMAVTRNGQSLSPKFLAVILLIRLMKCDISLTINSFNVGLSVS